MDYIHHIHSPLGGMTLSSDGEALTGLWFDGQRTYAETLSEARAEKELPVFEEADRWLTLYFSGREPYFTPPLRPKGSAFRKAVWEILLTVPYGETVTYGDIARMLAAERGAPCMSPQAVGGAVGHNPISIIIPCHRVVGANGSLTGYAAGVEKKLFLLALEGADAAPPPGSLRPSARPGEIFQ